MDWIDWIYINGDRIFIAIAAICVSIIIVTGVAILAIDSLLDRRWRNRRKLSQVKSNRLYLKKLRSGGAHSSSYGRYLLNSSSLQLEETEPGLTHKKVIREIELSEKQQVVTRYLERMRNCDSDFEKLEFDMRIYLKNENLVLVDFTSEEELLALRTRFMKNHAKRLFMQFIDLENLAKRMTQFRRMAEICGLTEADFCHLSDQEKLLFRKLHPGFQEPSKILLPYGSGQE